MAVAVSPYYKEGHKIYGEIKAAYDRHEVPEALRLYMGSYYEKKFSFIALDRKGSQDREHSFRNCWHAAFRVFLREGKIYPCPVAANIHHFNGHFGEKDKFQLTENDCIDIYQVKSEEEIVAFLSKPIDFCRFCDIGRRTEPLYTLTVTKKEQSEWVYN